MRLFTFIFSIYLFALSVVPCTDAFISYKNSVTQTSITADENHSDNHEDFCSPFCTCNCCGISMDFKFRSVFVKLPTLNVEFYKIIPNRKTSLFSDYNGSIWQPPKIIV